MNKKHEPIVDRKTELEKKRAKLEEIRKRKIERLNKSNEYVPLETDHAAISTKYAQNEIDDLLSQLNLVDICPSGAQPTQSEQNIFYKDLNRKQANLTIGQLDKVDICSKELITYAKETQTTYASHSKSTNLQPSRTNSFDDINLPLECYEGPFIYDTLQWEDEFHINSSMDENHTIDDDLCCFSIKNDDESLLKFLKKTTDIIENALNQDDIFFDYANLESKRDENTNRDALLLKTEFYEDQWKNRVVSSIDWSSQYPELIMASYSLPSTHHAANLDIHDFNDSDGHVVLWNLKSNKHTSNILSCTSWVTTCCFARFHPSLIIAGTYSGQIFMWDTRCNRNTPVQRSSFSTTSHLNPVYCMNVVGSQNEHNLISVSNDGRICTWTLDNMNTPIETVDLCVKQQTSVIPCTCMDFMVNNDNSFVVGSEDAYVYSVNRQSSKTSVDSVFEGHHGPLTSVSFNKTHNDYSNLFLTSSFDWTIKLWDFMDSTTPIYSFDDNTDYVYDAAWSPINPAIFASVDGAGRLSLWDLLNDHETPCASQTLSDGLCALNKLKWSCCGNYIACGDDNGRLSVLHVNENITKPKTDDFCLLNTCLNHMKDNYANLNATDASNQSFLFR